MLQQQLTLQLFLPNVTVPFDSALVFEKWRDDSGQAWAHVMYNGVSCAIGDAVTRQVSHPQLEQPLHVFPIEMLEQALQRVCLVPPSHAFPPHSSANAEFCLMRARLLPSLFLPQHTNAIRKFGRENMCRVRGDASPMPCMPRVTRQRRFEMRTRPAAPSSASSTAQPAATPRAAHTQKREVKDNVRLVLARTEFTWTKFQRARRRHQMATAAPARTFARALRRLWHCPAQQATLSRRENLRELPPVRPLYCG
jgi:hypothetical protein